VQGNVNTWIVCLTNRSSHRRRKPIQLL